MHNIILLLHTYYLLEVSQHGKLVIDDFFLRFYCIKTIFFFLLKYRCLYNCTEIKESSQIKYLGFIYDNKLNWKYHIEHITNILRTFFSIFEIFGQILDKKC